MMQATKLWNRDNPAFHIGSAHRFTSQRHFLRKRKMSPVVVVVADVVIQQAFQMPFFQNNHVVEQIPAAVTDPAFGDTVLPWTSEAGPFRLSSEALHRDRKHLPSANR